MKTIIITAVICLFIGFTVSSGCYLYWHEKDMTAVKAETIREATYALRQEIQDQVNIRIDTFDMDSMSDDQLIEFTGKRAVEYRKRYIDPNFKRDP